MKGENLYILVEAINMFLMIIKQESKEKSNEREALPVLRISMSLYNKTFLIKNIFLSFKYEFKNVCITSIIEFS